MNPGRTIVWLLTLLAAAFLSTICFTPIVIPAGEFRPTMAGIPLTLWAGGLIAICLVALTYVAGRVHPESDGGDRES